MTVAELIKYLEKYPSDTKIITSVQGLSSCYKDIEVSAGWAKKDSYHYIISDIASNMVVIIA